MMYMFCFKFGGMGAVLKQRWHAKYEKFRPLGNGVSECELLCVISLVKEGNTEQGI